MTTIGHTTTTVRLEPITTIGSATALIMFRVEAVVVESTPKHCVVGRIAAVSRPSEMTNRRLVGKVAQARTQVEHKLDAIKILSLAIEAQMETEVQPVPEAQMETEVPWEIEIRVIEVVEAATERTAWY